MILATGCVQKDSKCNWKPGDCKNICQSKNCYFDEGSKTCKQYIESGLSKGCCTSPPFESMADCNKACK